MSGLTVKVVQLCILGFFVGAAAHRSGVSDESGQSFAASQGCGVQQRVVLLVEQEGTG